MFLALVVPTMVLLIIGLQHYEYRSLLNAIEASEEQMRLFNDGQKAIVDSLAIVAPSNEWSSTESKNLTYSSISNLSGRTVVALQMARRDVSGVRIAPWFWKTDALKSAYLEHNNAWIESLTRISANPDLFWDDPKSQITPTWKIFCIQLGDYRPLLSFSFYQSRIGRICHDVETMSVNTTTKTLVIASDQFVAVSNQFIDNIQAGNSAAAYALFSTEAQRAVPTDQFNKLVRQIGPILNTSEQMTGKKITDAVTSKVTYEIQGSDGKTYVVTVNLTKESDDWKVLNFDSTSK